ncbi:N-acetylmuramoyl-L-alanine amidase [Fodinibius sediminis]|uniref:N-acetylmuramoyl-L-alanine amidase n=2 Tax=Fodinibius sediminis TaxID=1214077 RepID=A0A521DXU4_9BACT|nr:N-acetylmuramoyl-L-alanine amidase [Fodinibius sediminis]
MMPQFFFRLFFLVLVLSCITGPGMAQQPQHVLQGKTICLDPGHGGTAETDQYRVGPSGEREEWVNLRVGLALEKLLEEQGATVVMTRDEDIDVPLAERAQLAVEHEADLFVSIHHNATADPSVNFPIVYFHGNASENRAGVRLGRLLINRLSVELFEDENPASLVSDRVIFPGRGTSVLRGTYGIPAVLAEASFFTNPAEEQRLKDPDYNQREARAYLKAIKSFFASPPPPIHEKDSRVEVRPFQVLQEAERMKPVARKWRSNFIKGRSLYQKGDTLSLEQALDLFTISARSFPDSWLARQAHRYRARIFEKAGEHQKQREAETRVEEHYVPLLRNERYLNQLKKEN